jgi:hypothetical protein
MTARRYTYTHRHGLIVRSDGRVISTNPAHPDHQLYQAWLEAGNVARDVSKQPGEKTGPAPPHHRKKGPP